MGREWELSVIMGLMGLGHGPTCWINNRDVRDGTLEAKRERERDS